jgi:hypothetical protein
MSSPTQPTIGPLGPLAAPADLEGGLGASLPGSYSEGASGILAGRAGPPPSLLAEMARAERIHERLAWEGTVVGVSCAPDGGRPAFELRHPDGTVRDIPVAQAIEMACGSLGG